MKRALAPLAAALLCLPLCNACAETGVPRDAPPWLAERIAQFRREPVSSPPRTVLRYRYRDQAVYYFPPRCCDIPSELVDAEGKRLCAPDGGFTGQGDGKCADFHATRRDEERVWTDTRSWPPKR